MKASGRRWRWWNKLKPKLAMGKFYTEITPELKEFIAEQQMFFVATAAATGRINLSPKGIDTLRQLNEHTVAYLDLTGSGNETAAHVAADGRMTMMFCSFAGKPRILRLYGKGEVVPLEVQSAARVTDLLGGKEWERGHKGVSTHEECYEHRWLADRVAGVTLTV
jgi:pyridoxamine 5'-phosphate oxidase-like protein